MCMSGKGYTLWPQALELELSSKDEGLFTGGVERSTTSRPFRLQVWQRALPLLSAINRISIDHQSFDGI